MNIEPDDGTKGAIIEYCYHYGSDDDRTTGQDLDFTDGKEWRTVKRDIKLCIEAARKGELHDNIVHIEKVWHGKEEDESWLGYGSVFWWKDHAPSA